MRRRRNTVEASDSLDLLLDTICNTFGGVLFMAMLICLLSGGPAKPKRPEAEAAARERLRQLEALERRERSEAGADERLARARRDLAAAEANVARWAETLELPPERATALVVQLSNESNRVREALAAGEVVASLSGEAAELREKLAAAEEQLRQSRQKLTAVERAAEAARERAKTTLRVPTARETDKRQAVVFVSGGRMYAGIYPDDSYRRGVPLFRGTANNGGRDSLGPGDLPDKLGSPVVADAAAARAALAEQRVTGLDPQRDFVMFAVWPDSHEAFRLLRDAAGEKGLGYGLLLMDAGAAVTFGDAKSYEQ